MNIGKTTTLLSLRWGGFRKVRNSMSRMGGRWLKRGVLWAGATTAGMMGVRAEDHVDYRYEDYAEDGGRIHIRTHGLLFDAELKPWMSLKGNYIYDSISGATPLGAPPLPGEAEVAKATIEDIRRAGYIEPSFKISNHTLSPQLSYSTESDYESVGIALNHSIETNEKNTTYSWGISQTFDRVLPNLGASIDEPVHKDTTDILFGVSQLLGPKTILTLNVTLGYSQGFLTDPYKRVLFTDFPYTPGFPYTVWPERRPDHRFRQVFYASLQQYFDSLNGAAEGSYRFHHDDFGIFAHTLTLQWHQKITKILRVSPMVRYHRQSAAKFYGTAFAGDPSFPVSNDPGSPASDIPRYYSSDYRVSELESWTYGVAISARIHKHLSLEFAYKRYQMRGLDGVTVSDQYPKAHVFTGGLGIWF